MDGEPFGKGSGIAPIAVTLASRVEFHWPPLSVHDAQKPDGYSGDSWCPGRWTVVFIGSLAFGLTIFETTEEVEVRYDWQSPIRYIRVSAAPLKRKPAWQVSTQPMRSICRVVAWRTA